MQQRVRGRRAQTNRERILKRDNGLCAHCAASGKLTKATEVDHITPLFKGGADSDDNKQSLCHECHAVKTAQDLGKRPRPRIGLDGVPTGLHHWNT